jgi:hypothetical protein
VKYERTASFKSDYRRLNAQEKQLFREAVEEFNKACDRFAEANDPSVFPKSLRVSSMANAPGIFEMTWSFSGPDGRATWEWTEVDSMDPSTKQPVRERAVRWRRIGGHAIFKSP